MIDILNIIIADDNLILANLMKTLIEKNEKYRIVGIAKNEEEEIKLIDSLKPDLVITDLKKNGKWTGFDIIEKYRLRKSNVEFFIISAGAIGNIQQIENLNIKYYLNKPYSNIQLFEILERFYEIKYPKSILQVERSLVNINKKQSFFKRLIEKIKYI